MPLKDGLAGVRLSPTLSAIPNEPTPLATGLVRPDADALQVGRRVKAPAGPVRVALLAPANTGRAAPRKVARTRGPVPTPPVAVVLRRHVTNVKGAGRLVLGARTPRPPRLPVGAGPVGVLAGARRSRVAALRPVVDKVALNATGPTVAIRVGALIAAEGPPMPVRAANGPVDVRTALLRPAAPMDPPSITQVLPRPVAVAPLATNGRPEAVRALRPRPVALARAGLQVPTLAATPVRARVALATNVGVTAALGRLPDPTTLIKLAAA